MHDRRWRLLFWLRKKTTKDLNINIDRVEIDFNYDNNRQFIENIEIVIFDPDGVIEKSLFQ